MRGRRKFLRPKRHLVRGALGTVTRLVDQGTILARDTPLDRDGRRDPRWRESPCKGCWYWLRDRHAVRKSCVMRGFHSPCEPLIFPKCAGPTNRRLIMCGVWRKKRRSRFRYT